MHGFVFANLSRNPLPLGPRLQGLEALVRNYHMEEMATRYVVEDVWPVNWKCFIENFMEAYHLSPLHKTMLHRTAFSRNMITRHTACIFQRSEGHNCQTHSPSGRNPALEIEGGL